MSELYDSLVVVANFSRSVNDGFLSWTNSENGKKFIRQARQINQALVNFANSAEAKMLYQNLSTLSQKLELVAERSTPYLINLSQQLASAENANAVAIISSENLTNSDSLRKTISNFEPEDLVEVSKHYADIQGSPIIPDLTEAEMQNALDQFAGTYEEDKSFSDNLVTFLGSAPTRSWTILIMFIGLLLSIIIQNIDLPMPESAMYITRSNVNLRMEPSEDSEVLKLMQQNEIVRYQGTTDNQYVSVEYIDPFTGEEVIGWVSSNYVIKLKDE